MRRLLGRFVFAARTTTTAATLRRPLTTSSVVVSAGSRRSALFLRAAGAVIGTAGVIAPCIWSSQPSKTEPAATTATTTSSKKPAEGYYNAPSLSLSPEQRLAYNHSWQQACKSFDGLSQEHIMLFLKEYLSVDSYYNLNQYLTLANDFIPTTTTAPSGTKSKMTTSIPSYEPFISLRDLQKLAGYIVFIGTLGIANRNLPLEIRLEKHEHSYRMYGLLPLDRTVLFSRDGGNPDTLKRLHFTQGADDFVKRFLQTPTGPAIRLGAGSVGLSKFVSLGLLDPNWSRQQIIDHLAIQNASYIQRGLDMYLFNIDLPPAAGGGGGGGGGGGSGGGGSKSSPPPAAAAAAAGGGGLDLNQLFSPRAIIWYKLSWFDRDARAFTPAPDFLVDTIPGYTLGGAPEAVFRTFDVSGAKTVDDLKPFGISVSCIPNTPSSATAAAAAAKK